MDRTALQLFLMKRGGQEICVGPLSTKIKTTLQLFLMKRGGQEIYVGPLDHHSYDLIKHFELMPGVVKINEGYNPATWMLKVTTPAQEMTLGVDFTNLYKNSDLYMRKKP
ncbi:hypothetical protein P3S68_012473 [Capsicum galapagoense]